MRRGAPLAIGAGLLAATAVGVVLRQSARASGGEEAIEHRPSAHVLRLPALAEPTFAVDAALVQDFDAAEDRLAVLDAMNARVLVLRAGVSGWEPDLAFGQRGDGPGEMRSPNGIAFTGDGGIVVADETRLHFFTASGAYVRSTQPKTACQLQRPGVAGGRTGLFLHGTCMRRDSAMAQLYWTVDGESFVPVATDVRYTLDGRFGSMLGSISPFSEGDGRHLFGVGNTNCIYDVRDHGARPFVTRVCELAVGRYRAPPPAALQERLQREGARRPEFRRLLRWPEVLPVYVEVLAVGEQAVLVRPFSPDSVVFEVAGARREVLVAPYNGFVGCRRYGCLWTDHTADSVRLTLLRRERVAEVMASQGSGR
jgi:hypothetical protein